MRSSLVLVTFAFCVGSTQPSFAQPGDLELLEEELPQVTIVKRGDDTVAEFRLHGRLYMVRVTLANGLSYYLIDHEGDGRWVRHESGQRLIVPAWVIASW